MKVNYYAIKDVLTDFKSLVSFENDDVAKRQFLIMCAGAPDSPVNDFILYRIGVFDTKTGRFEDEDEPIFIARGERKDDDE